MTYIRAGSCVRTCSSMCIYVWPDAYIRVDLCHRMCSPMRRQKTLMFSKKMVMFLKNITIFFKKLGMFLCKGRWNHPHQVGHSFFFRSFLHFIQNMRIISRLRMTGPPLILLSAVLSKSLHKLPSAIPLCTFYTSF